MKRFIALAFLAPLVLGGCAFERSGSSSADYAASSTMHRTFPSAGVRRLSVRNVSGPVIVTAWTRPEISVEAIVRARDNEALHRVSVDMQTQRDELSVQTDTAGGSIFNFGDEGEVAYTIHAPAATVVRIENVSGSVAVEHMHARLSVTDVSGEVTVKDIDGSVDLSTTSGAIDATLAAMQAGQRARLRSVSGDVHLTVPKKSGLDVTASSVSGDFSSNFSIAAQEKTVGTSVAGAVNGGGATVSLSTISGAMMLTGR